MCCLRRVMEWLYLNGRVGGRRSSRHGERLDCMYESSDGNDGDDGRADGGRKRKAGRLTAGCLAEGQLDLEPRRLGHKSRCPFENERHT